MKKTTPIIVLGIVIAVLLGTLYSISFLQFKDDNLILPPCEQALYTYQEIVKQSTPDPNGQLMLVSHNMRFVPSQTKFTIINKEEVSGCFLVRSADEPFTFSIDSPLIKCPKDCDTSQDSPSWIALDNAEGDPLSIAANEIKTVPFTIRIPEGTSAGVYLISPQVIREPEKEKYSDTDLFITVTE